MLWELVVVPQRLPVGLSIPEVSKAGLLPWLALVAWILLYKAAELLDLHPHAD